MEKITFEEQCLIKLENIQIRSAEDVYSLLENKMGNLKKEFFIVLYLNTKSCLIKGQIISIGTLNTSLVYPREVFRTAIVEGANSIILVHNHPSGDPTPSQQDIDVTDALKKSAKVLCVTLLDHVIISSTGYHSFKEKEI